MRISPRGRSGRRKEKKKKLPARRGARARTSLRVPTHTIPEVLELGTLAYQARASARMHLSLTERRSGGGRWLERPRRGWDAGEATEKRTRESSGEGERERAGSAISSVVFESRLPVRPAVPTLLAVRACVRACVLPSIPRMCMCGCSCHYARQLCTLQQWETRTRGLATETIELESARLGELFSALVLAHPPFVDPRHSAVRCVAVRGRHVHRPPGLRAQDEVRLAPAKWTHWAWRAGACR